MKDYGIKDFILLPDVDNFSVNENNIRQEPLIDNFIYVKENDKVINKNFPSEIDNNEEENKADNSVSDHDNIAKSIKIKYLFILIKILKREILVLKKKLTFLLKN